MDMVKSKTFWTGVVTCVVSIVKACGVEVPDEAVIGLLGLMGIFLRMGIQKTL